MGDMATGLGRTRETLGTSLGTLGDYLREQRLANRLSLRQLADAAGVSNPYLSQIERGLRRPSADVLQSIAKALRISSETLYVQAGILSPEQTEERSVELAIRADPGLTERQKDALVDIYRSLRAANGVLQDSSEAAAPPSSDVPGSSAASTYDSEHDNSVEGH